jgi:Lipocalin-like domain
MKVQLTGTWRLVSCIRTFKDGSTSLPWGEKPVGQVIYLDNGRMSAQIMRPGRRTTVPPGLDYGSSQATDQEIREAVSGFMSYFGTYSVDEATNTVTHHVEAALVPGWVGTSLVRTFQIDSSGQLILTRQVPGETDVLVWRRMAD